MLIINKSCQVRSQVAQSDPQKKFFLTYMTLVPNISCVLLDLIQFFKLNSLTDGASELQQETETINTTSYSIL